MRCLDIAGDIIPADDIENDVGAASLTQDRDKILFPEIDGPLCPQALAPGAGIRAISGGKDPQPQGGTDLDSG